MLLDTSVVIRFLTGDDPKKADRFITYLERHRVILTDIGIAEIAWTLLKQYAFTKGQVVNGLVSLINHQNIRCNRHLWRKVLSLYQEKNVPFIDCYLAIIALDQTNGQILSYDRDFDKVPGLKRIEP